MHQRIGRGLSFDHCLGILLLAYKLRTEWQRILSHTLKEN
jgi:hypothetical protein